MTRNMRMPATDRTISIAAYLLLFLSALWMKRFYSRAGSDDLLWILTPTARLVEWTAGLQFAYETATGFVDRHRGIIIAPGCAGVNFMIMAFGAAGCAGLSQRAGIRRQLTVLCAAAAGAYLTTIAANALRIAAADALYRADIYGGWVTPGRVHRLAGILVYLPLLCGVHAVAGGCAAGKPRPQKTRSPAARGRAVVPALWYLAFTIGVPAVNRAFDRYPRQFAEHCLMAAGGCVIAFGAVYLVQGIMRRKTGRPAGIAGDCR